MQSTIYSRYSGHLFVATLTDASDFIYLFFPFKIANHCPVQRFVASPVFYLEIKFIKNVKIII
jgi:hypothetical protein